MLRIAANLEAKLHHRIEQCTLELFIGHRLKLARRANLATFNAMASQHADFLNRRNSGAELAALNAPHRQR
jgi:hypothetical protein